MLKWALIAVLIAVLLLFSSYSRKVAEEAAIEVNGESIVKKEFNQAYDDLLTQYQRYFPQYLEGAEGAIYKLQIRKSVADSLIYRTLLAQECQKKGIKVSGTEVDEEFQKQYQDLLARYGLNEEQLEEILKEQGMTLEGYKGKLRDQIKDSLKQERLKDIVVGEIEPTDEQLNHYFERNRDRYTQPEQVRASHILLKTQSEAEKVLDELKAGADFAALAEQYSQDPGSAQNGGDLGYFPRGRMVKEFEDAAFALKVGEISEIVKSQFGYHIIKLVDRKEAEEKSLEDVKEEVKQEVIKEEESKRFEDWYNNLKGKAKIEIRLALLKAYALEETDPDQALKEYEKVAKEGLSDDPYLHYYIGKLYEEKFSKEKEAGYKAKAAENYLQVAKALSEAEAKVEMAQKVLDLNPEDPGVRGQAERIIEENLPQVTLSPGNPTKGSPDAPVTIIEFAEFYCPYCARYLWETFPKIEEAYIKKGLVKYVFCNWPVHGDPAILAAQAGECANEQGLFWPFHDRLFDVIFRERNGEQLDKKGLEEVAAQVGLDTEEFASCFDSGRYAEEVQNDISYFRQWLNSIPEEQRARVGTPTFSINGRILIGAQPFEEFSQIIEEELAKE